MYNVITIADFSVYYSFKNEETAGYFGPEICTCIDKPKRYITVPDNLIHRYIQANNCNYAYAEYMNTIYVTSNYLLRYNCCSFHSVAVSVNGKGFLLTGVSGTGKTTQYLNLKSLYPKQIKIINGDKPFLKFTNDDIMIHSSPWRGKENYGSDIACRLAGIIFLHQSDHNEIKLLRGEDIAVKSLSMFLYYPDCEETIRKVCELDRRLLNSVPLWFFMNKGNLDSSRLLFQNILNGSDNP